MSLVRAQSSERYRQFLSPNFLTFIRLVAVSFAAHWFYFVTNIIYGLVGALFVFRLPGVNLKSIGEMSEMFVMAAIPAIFGSALLALAIFHFFRIATVVRPERPAQALYQAMKADVLDPRRYIIGLPVFIAMFVFMNIFSQIKANITLVNPFSWDEAFMKLDYWLHFGNHPWELLQPLVGHPFVTFLIAKLYSVWLGIMWITWMWLAFDKRLSLLRTQFFAAFFLTWMIGGGLLAIVFSSAGPVYYSNLGLSPDPFIGLFNYLRDANETFAIDSLFVQDVLWDAHTGKVSLVAGISAMPSMHNATALLFVLVTWPVSRRLGMAMAAFAFVIFIGSIHLGWHYAVDGYLGFAVALPCWWIAGRFARWHNALPVYVRFERLLQTSYARRGEC